ncbi:MAG: hypothetical protein ABIQ00_09265 [Chitinophagaceae bacterium]
MDCYKGVKLVVLSSPPFSFLSIGGDVLKRCEARFRTGVVAAE